jgi:hypothetical protein
MGKSRLFCMVVTALVISLGLVACGGGGGDSTSSAPATSVTSAQGFWSGSTTGHTLAGIILDDGTYYVMYFAPGSSYLPDGFIQGNGTSNNGVFTSSNARNFNFTGAGVLTATLSGTYTEKQFLAGVFNYADGSSAPFSATYDSIYETAPQLASLVGGFHCQIESITGSEYVDMNIAANGDISGSGSYGCTVSGKIIPRAHGNVFDAMIAFGSACSAANQTLTGIAGYSVSTQILYALLPYASRTNGVLFIGIKQPASVPLAKIEVVSSTPVTTSYNKPSLTITAKNTGLATGYNASCTAYAHNSAGTTISTATAFLASLGDIGVGQTAIGEAVFFDLNSHNDYAGLTFDCTWLTR